MTALAIATIMAGTNAPTAVTANPGPPLTLAWDASATVPPPTYLLCVGDTPNSFYTNSWCGAALQFTISNLPVGTHWFAAEAVASNGAVSLPSNVVTNTTIQTFAVSLLYGAETGTNGVGLWCGIGCETPYALPALQWQAVVLERSSDLAAWTPVYTNEAVQVGVPAAWTDAAAPANGAFYRVEARQ